MGRILVVDDDERIRMLLRAHLRQTGHRVLLAPSAEEAMAAVEEHGAPDVAVLDVALPDVDGFDLAEKLQATAAPKRIPVIFLSAHVDDSHIDRGRQMGAVYLTKPYIRAALVNAIEKALAELDDW
ncbi:MAG: response regulator [Acidimicrobiales bacterium]